MGEKGLGYNSYKVNPSIEHKGWRSPKFIEGTTLYDCLFTDVDVKILRREDSSVAFTGRLKGKLYLVDFTTSRVTSETCLVAKSDKGLLWHRRLAHVVMRTLAKLQKDNHVIGLTNVVFEKDKVCVGTCSPGQVDPTGK
jgi:hypothetical protein